MVDQFEAYEPRAIQPPGNSDGTNPGTRAECWCKTPGVAGKVCWRLELTDALHPL